MHLNSTVLCVCADVDVLQVDGASITSSMEDQQQQKRGTGPGTTLTNKHDSGGGTLGRNGGSTDTKKGTSQGGAAGNTPAAGDDLRNYAYEGEGSSPGSLSSCKSSSSSRGKLRCLVHFTHLH